MMNTTDYKMKAQALLSDSNTYKVLTKDPTARYTDNLIKLLQDFKKSGNISDIQYKRLYPTSTMIPRFYGLPKIHKSDIPLRPIVASRGSLTYQVAKYVAYLLAPLVGRNGFALKNSADLVAQMKDCTLDDDDILVSFDVTALFTSTPVQKSLEIIFETLTQDDTLPSRTNLTAAQVRDLLAVCLHTTYFVHDGVIYSQIEGAAMGSPVSPIVANLFMEWFESHAIETFIYELKLWRRYVDDTMVILSDALLEDFTLHINSVHPAISFTREEEEDGCIAMLDAKITKGPEGKLSFSVYRKKTHTDQYLQFQSNQPLQHKLGVIRTLHHRCQTICSDPKAKKAETLHLKKVLSVSGYTKGAWDTALQPKTPKVAQDPNRNPSKGSVTLPYVGHLSDAVARVLRKSGVSVHMKPYNTLRSKLVHPKDKVEPKDKTGVVYHIKCKDCDSSYVGETERALKKRLKEHKRSSSPVGHHMMYNTHEFEAENVTVVHQEQGWFRRGVAEAVHISRIDPNLNRDRGRHNLPVIYREIIPSCDLTATSRSHVITHAQ